MSKTVLIAGASRGIGLELCRQYAVAGWHVIAGCRAPNEANSLKLLTQSYDLSIYPLDTGSHLSVRDFYNSVASEAIDVLIVVAGVLGGDHRSLEDFDFEDFANALNINTAGPLRLAQVFSSNLAASGGAKLVALTSQLGSIEQTSSTDMMAYRISKAALNAAWKCVSVALKDQNVTTMVIHPGWVATDMGGEDGPVSPQASAKGIRAVIDELSPKDSGSFKTWEGDSLPW